MSMMSEFKSFAMRGNVVDMAVGIVIGGAFGVLFPMVLNPILYKKGILSHWNPQMGVVDTLFTNNVDFYLSFSLGLTVAITCISLGKAFRPLMNALRQRRGGQACVLRGPIQQRRGERAVRDRLRVQRLRRPEVQGAAGVVHPVLARPVQLFQQVFDDAVLG